MVNRERHHKRAADSGLASHRYNAAEDRDQTTAYRQPKSGSAEAVCRAIQLLKISAQSRQVVPPNSDTRIRHFDAQPSGGALSWLIAKQKKLSSEFRKGRGATTVVRFPTVRNQGNC